MFRHFSRSLHFTGHWRPFSDFGLLYTNVWCIDMLFTFERFFICLRVLFIICVDFQSKLKRFTASWQRNLHRANSTKQISQTKYQIAPIKLPESTKNVNIPWIQIGWKETFLTNKVLQITFFPKPPQFQPLVKILGALETFVLRHHKSWCQWQPPDTRLSRRAS